MLGIFEFSAYFKVIYMKVVKWLSKANQVNFMS